MKLYKDSDEEDLSKIPDLDNKDVVEHKSVNPKQMFCIKSIKNA